MQKTIEVPLISIALEKEILWSEQLIYENKWSLDKIQEKASNITKWWLKQ